MAKETGPATIELIKEELDALKNRIKNKQLTADDYYIFEKVLQFAMWVPIQLKNAKTTMRKLKEMIFGQKTEKRKPSKNNHDSTLNDPVDTKTEDITLSNQETQKEEISSTAANQDNINVPKKKGHGRRPATDYIPDEIIAVTHETLKAGDYCPTDCGGRLYLVPITAGGIIRVKGQSCAHVISYEFQRLRCSLCGDTFTPQKPIDFPAEKYDEHFKSIMVVQKYFLATPFFRQEAYQNMIGFPLADATQWDIVESVADGVYPIFKLLEKISANYTNINNDDTRVKILDVMKDNKLNPDKERTGMYTTCILATEDKKPTICLYYSSVKHSGENIEYLLEKRDKTLSPIQQMCDALPANIPKTLNIILCNCLAHGRRKFIEISYDFISECEFVIEQLGLVYHHDDQAKKENMSPEERLAYHKKNSKPVMDALRIWMREQFDDRKVEPSSGLGKAISYMQNHWEPLTRFLFVAGAHLDNNIVERALKLAIRTRKNAMFHKSEHGAYVAGLLLSIIQTCKFSGINPVDYLTELQKNKSAIFRAPDLWLPWAYKATLANIENIFEQEVA